MTATEVRAVVVEHGGKSYIKIFSPNHYYSDLYKDVAANGVAGLEKAPGDDGFAVFDGSPVVTLEKLIPARKITTKYVLREDLRGAAKEETISVSDYNRLSESDQSLYGPVYEEIPRTAEPIPFVTQTEDGPPSALPRGVVCTDKNYFARFRSFHHLGPVMATDRYVIYRLAHAMKKLMGENPYIKNSTHGVPADPFREFLSEQYRTSFFIDVMPMTVNGIEVTAKGLATMFTVKTEDSRLGYARLVQGVVGDSLSDLEAKIDQYIEALIRPHRSWVQPTECPCCHRRFKKASAA